MQTATTVKQAKSPWLAFWLAWVLANVVGWALMSVQSLMPFRWVHLGGLLSIGFGISLLQWLCLRSFLDAGYAWLLVSTATYGGYLWVLTLLAPSVTMTGLLAGSLVSLFTLSWLQRYALNELVDGATAWVFVSPLAATLAFFLMWALAEALRWTHALPSAAAFGAIYGASTGALLILLKAATKARPAADDSIPPWKRPEG